MIMQIELCRKTNQHTYAPNEMKWKRRALTNTCKRNYIKTAEILFLFSLVRSRQLMSATQTTTIIFISKIRIQKLYK